MTDRKKASEEAENKKDVKDLIDQLKEGEFADATKFAFSIIEKRRKSSAGGAK